MKIASQAWTYRSPQTWDLRTNTMIWILMTQQVSYVIWSLILKKCQYQNQADTWLVHICMMLDRIARFLPEKSAVSASPGSLDEPPHRTQECWAHHNIANANVIKKSIGITIESQREPFTANLVLIWVGLVSVRR